MNKRASIWRIKRDIWTKFSTELMHQSTVIPTFHIQLSRKSQMAEAAIFNFRKSQDWINVFPPYLVDICITAMWRWSHEQNLKPKVNSYDVTSRTSETKVHRLQPHLLQSTSTIINFIYNWKIQKNIADGAISIAKIPHGSNSECHCI